AVPQAAAAPSMDDGMLLLALPAAEVLRLGLISNRGLVVLGGLAVTVSQLNPQLPDDVSIRWGKALSLFFGSHHFSVAEYTMAGASVALAFIVLLRLFSISLALLQYWGFRLE